MSFSYLRNSDNKITAASVTANSTAAGYSADNTLVLPLSKVHRSTGMASEYLEFDLGSAQSITFVAILNHNLSSSAVITVKGGASANPSTFTQVMTWREFDAYATFSSQSYRYWRITFADSNTDGFIQVGYVMIGTHTTPSIHFRYGWHLESQFNNRRLESDYFVPNIEEVSRRVKLSMTFWPLEASGSDIVRKTLYESLKMDLTPFFIIPDTTVYDGWFVRFSRTIDMKVDIYRQIDIALCEDGRGNRLGV